MRLPILCEGCKTELSGGLDTFGELGHELCFTCQINRMEDSFPRMEKSGKWVVKGFSEESLRRHRYNRATFLMKTGTLYRTVERILGQEKSEDEFQLG